MKLEKLTKFRESFSTKFRAHPVWWSLGLIVSTLLTLIVIAALLVGAIAYNYINKNGSETIGRDFSIGKLDIDWGWKNTRIVIDKIRMANTEGSKDADMVNIEKLDVTIQPYKIFIGKIELPKLIIEKPKILLEKIDKDHKNWELPIMSKQNAVEESVTPDDRGEFPVIGELRITDGVLIYRDHEKNMNLELALSTVKGDGGDDKQRGEESFEISGTGSLQDQKFELEAKGGSLDLLRDSTKEFPLDLTLKMGATKVAVNGTFTDPVKVEGINAKLEISGNNLADIFYLTGIPLPPTPPYSLSGQLRKEGDIWSYTEFKGKTGDSDLSGNLKYDLSGERGKLTADLLSNKLDGDDLAGFIGAPPSTKPGETASAEQKKQKAQKAASPRLIPDVPLQTERLKSADMDVTLKAKKLAVPSVPFDAMTARFLLNNGHLRVDPLTVSLADGTIDGYVDINANEKNPPMKIDLNLKSLRLKRFFEGSRFADLSAGRFGGKIQLAGRGLTLAEVLASSSGRITMIMSGGKISLLIIEAADIDLAQASPLLLGEDRSTEIRCGVTDFTVKNGILSSKAVVFDTSDSLLVGRLDINLRNETIDGLIDSKPKDASLLSAQAPITIRGKLKSPGIGLEPVETGLRATAAAVLGTLLTPFAAIIPFIELGEAKDVNCRALLNNAGK